MTTVLQSRNPFTDPAMPTFADLIGRIRADTLLPPATRQNLLWGLGAVARAAGKPPAVVPAHPEFLRKVFAQAAPASIGLSRAGWNNARSLTGKALAWAGLATVPGHYQAPFAAEWARLWDLLPPGKDALRMQLARLFHYCSAQGIPPEALTDAVLAAFHDALTTESIVEQPYALYRGAAKSWNNAIDRVPGWPRQRLAVPSRQQLFTLPWSAFPPSLQADVEAYLRRAAGLTLDDDHFTRAQRPATLATRGWQLRLFATAIVRGGILPPDELTSLPELLKPEVAAAGLQFLLDRNSGESGVQLSNLADFLPTLARRLDMPSAEIARLTRMKRKLKVSRHGMTERNRAALRAFDDPAAVKALLSFPFRIWREVRASGRTGRREARLMQTALAVELLLNAPVRIQNLASIEIERHLIDVGGPRDRTLHLRFPAAEVKNANDLEFPLMPEATALLDTCLTEWRPLVVAGGCPFLFPGKQPGRHKGKGALSSQIREVVHAYTRLDMPAHRFRHAVGKIFLDRNPGEYEVVRLLLGHKSTETTIAFYTGAESASAARHYAETVLRGRGGLIPGAEARRG